MVETAAHLLRHEGGDYGEVNTGSTTLAFSAYSLMRHMGKNPHPADPRRRDHAVWADHCLCGRPQARLGQGRLLEAGHVQAGTGT